MLPRSCQALSGLVLLLVAWGCGPSVPERDDADAVIWASGPPLPSPVTNNAVAAVRTDSGVSVFSFLGMDSTKAWGGVTGAAYRWDVGTDGGWRTVPSVPGPGRLAATAQAVRGKIYVMGGYTVARDGRERTVSDVDVYDPATDTWSRGADIPVPVDDAVSGVWRDSLIVLVSGWHDTSNVGDVQWYDPAADRWSAGTPIAGTPVFGHTGTVVGDEIVYVDGVRVADGDPRFALNDDDWVGRVTPDGPGAVEWSTLPPHPPPGLYRAAGGALGRLALFVGGTSNPYNYDGVGYDGTPAEPIRQVLAFAPGAGEWRTLAAPPLATMDHRNLGVAGGMVFLVGGMEAGQKVSGKVWFARADKLLATIW
ncbi:MAG: kelch repeat-containing protein [Gemmatimonadota bacterium]